VFPPTVHHTWSFITWEPPLPYCTVVGTQKTIDRNAVQYSTDRIELGVNLLCGVSTVLYPGLRLLPLFEESARESQRCFVLSQSCPRHDSATFKLFRFWILSTQQCWISEILGMMIPPIITVRVYSVYLLTCYLPTMSRKLVAHLARRPCANEVGSLAQQQKTK